MENKRNTNLYILRGISALWIFAYHAYHDMQIDFGLLNPLISHSSFCMTLFFILSGYVIYYNYANYEWGENGKLIHFYGKRITSIYPLYFLLWVFCFAANIKATPIIYDIITFPLNYFLFQEISFYVYPINLATWFFSCIMICYLVAPLIIRFLREVDNKFLILFAAVVLVILITTVPLVDMIYDIESYHNVFGRMWEFMLGMLVGRYIEVKRNSFSFSNNTKGKLWGTILSVIVVMGTYLVFRYSGIVAEHQEGIKPIAAISTVLLIYLYATSYDPVIYRIGKLKVMTWLSEYSFEIWVATTIVSFVYGLMLEGVINNNWINMVIVFAGDFLLAYVLKQYNKLVKGIINRFGIAKFMAGVL